ncbi:MAG TPA: efflux transporter periplasmic adaptor subunit [Bacteroidales bacterium]|jgi:membrane fusion protein, multidrug efflux system|nr:efflux transporter periplasmic adaptor subunit [Bacteroidales bacterium]HBZ22603.1 efflux transporter periplasmic adaptor subunit [Bacteroidales bacterium]
MKYFKTLLVIMISGLILSACSSKKETTTPENATTVTETAAKPVKVLALAKSRISRTIDYTATILPFEEVNMAPSTPGRIDKIYVEEGDRVNKGQDLFLMDRTMLYQQKVQLSSLAKDLARLDTLLTTGSIKQQQYDQLKTQYDVTKTNVDFMEENTLLKAPFYGVVTGKYFENGELYSGSPTTATGRAAVVTIMQVNPLKVNVSISEQYYPLIKKGMKANVTADVYENENFTATVYRISPTINPGTRSFNVELELPNRKEMLKPGMFVRVSMDLGEVETYVVPAGVVLVQEGTNIRYVFLDKDNKAERVEVSLGKRFDDKLEILSNNIKEGDQIVSEGQAKLNNGDKIEIVK